MLQRSGKKGESLNIFTVTPSVCPLHEVFDLGVLSFRECVTAKRKDKRKAEEMTRKETRKTSLVNCRKEFLEFTLAFLLAFRFALTQTYSGTDHLCLSVTYCT